MARAKRFGRRLPLLVEKGEDGFYVVECPVLEGCYTQGKTMDEALRNIRDVIAVILEEKESQEVLKRYNPEEISLHTILVQDVETTAFFGQETGEDSG